MNHLFILPWIYFCVWQFQSSVILLCVARSEVRLQPVRMFPVSSESHRASFREDLLSKEIVPEHLMSNMIKSSVLVVSPGRHREPESKPSDQNFMAPEQNQHRRPQVKLHLVKFLQWKPSDWCVQTLPPPPPSPLLPLLTSTSCRRKLEFF